METTLEQRLRETAAGKQGTYDTRTRHLDDAGRPLFVNRLVLEDSPYLLQHAHNPVDWYAWGDEAFASARAQGKPVFLSIGYSTCHWCHVMEAESFDNADIGRLLNRHFVSIKLDREQYPDIDEIYMTGVQLVSGHGGWPMSNFLTPDGEPFYGATYFPPAQFAELLQRIADLWQSRRGELEQSASRIAASIRELLQARKSADAVDLEAATQGIDRLLTREDRQQGGLAGAPKFPQEPLLLYFLDRVTRARHLGAAGFLRRALDGMGRGGIHDHVGGGFHRYSTDADWLVPHFEKMLYNQSQLAAVYLRAWMLTGDPFHEWVLRHTLDYVAREMQQPGGGFFSATDADSEDEEGRYFVWHADELRRALHADQFNILAHFCTLTEDGNFEGANILALRDDLPELAGTAPGQSLERLQPVLEQLRGLRQQRIAPLRDDKLIVAWSASMATSFAWAGWALEETAYLETAERAVDFIWHNNRLAQGSLKRIWLHGVASIPAQLEDYANLCEACIVLHDLTGKADYLERAVALMQDMASLFWNESSGGFCPGPPPAGGPLLARSASASDGATLSAPGVALDCLVALLRRGKRMPGVTAGFLAMLEQRLSSATGSVAAGVQEYPAAHPTVVRALSHRRSGSCQPIQFAAGGLLRVELRLPLPRPGGRPAAATTLVFGLEVAGGMELVNQADPAGGKESWSVSLAPEERHWKIDAAVRGETGAGTGAAGGASAQSSLIEVRLSRTSEPEDELAATVGICLRLQLCDDLVCLPAETLSFRVRS